ncbi:MAG: DUF3656 domain-containing U32 family peptidase [Lachnospiraceae bacterium]
MRRTSVEILAPAGSYESMVAAIAAGADAVYIGGSKFGARAYADNLGEDQMRAAIDYAHLHGCKLYMTVNTLVKEKELDQLYDYLKPYYEQGLDAVIVQDMGVFSFIRTHFPDLPIHASTQMTITGVYGAKTLAALGAERIVTARELSLEEIRQIHEEVDVEIESFVHGALCYCYSGQCLFSSLIGGRSGNRGRCAQPCRLPYEVRSDGKLRNPGDQKQVLSLKDLCTLDIIPDMIEAGVYSMKIEGRMKSPRYTAGVVSIYRKYVDQYLRQGRKGYVVDPKDKKLLLDLFDRGGFTEGYYRQHNGRDMVALGEKPAFREANQQLFDYLDETYVNGKTQIEIEGQVYFEAGQPAVMTVQCGEIGVSVQGEQAQTALNQPATEEKLRKQLKKTGGTPFVFRSLDIFVTGDIFMPVQALNELRRTALERLEQEMTGQYHRESLNLRKPEPAEISPKPDMTKSWESSEEMGFHVSLENPEGLSAVLAVEEVDEIYIDSTGFGVESWKDSADRCRAAHKKCALILPHIFRQEAVNYFMHMEKPLKEAGFDAMVVRSLEEVEFLKDLGVELPLIFDAPMYTFNHLAEQMMEDQGAFRLTLPVELNSRELEELGCHGREMIVYGYLPMMVSAQCIQKTTDRCTKREGILWMKDRMGKEFPVKNHCRFCYNTIYNSSPLSLAGQETLIRRLGPASVRLQFTLESPEEISEITGWYRDVYCRGSHGASSVSLPGAFWRSRVVTV